jgi:valyl-tRNA synthetase
MATIAAYSLGEAAKGLYEFIWGDFCDWYIELVKSRLWQEQTSTPRLIAQQTLAYVLEGILKLLHPFMPHITEEIWQTLTQSSQEEHSNFLALQAYPEVAETLINPELEQSFDLLFGTIRTIRNLRAEAVIKQGVKITVILQSESDRENDILKLGETFIKDLAKVEQLTIVKTLAEDPGQVIAGVQGTVQVLIPLTGVVDVALLRTKLEKSLAKVEGEINSLKGRLGNPGFVNKAPANVIQEARDSLAEAETQAEILRDRLQRLN